MAKYVERETEVEVEIWILPPYLNSEPVAHITFPNGLVYGLPASRIHEFFDHVTPQLIEIGAIHGGAYER